MLASAVSCAFFLISVTSSEVWARTCDVDAVNTCVSTHSGLLDDLSSHPDLYRCVSDVMGTSPRPLSQWCSAWRSSYTCLHELLLNSYGRRSSNYRLALRGTIAFLKFNCKPQQVTVYERHKKCIYGWDERPRQQLHLCLNLFRKNIQTRDKFMICPHMTRLLRCVATVGSLCGQQTVDWLQRSLQSFLRPTTLAMDCTDLQAKVQVSNGSAGCSDDWLKSCIRPFFPLVSRAPVFPDLSSLLQTIEMTNILDWCLRSDVVIQCLDQRQAFCSGFDKALIEGTREAIRHVCSDTQQTERSKMCLFNLNRDLNSKLKHCDYNPDDTSQYNQDHAIDRFCRIQEDEVSCRHEHVTTACGEDVADWLDDMHRLLIAPMNAITLRCRLEHHRYMAIVFGIAAASLLLLFCLISFIAKLTKNLRTKYDGDEDVDLSIAYRMMADSSNTLDLQLTAMDAAQELAIQYFASGRGRSSIDSALPSEALRALSKRRATEGDVFANLRKSHAKPRRKRHNTVNTLSDVKEVDTVATEKSCESSPSNEGTIKSYDEKAAESDSRLSDKPSQHVTTDELALNLNTNSNNNSCDNTHYTSEKVEGLLDPTHHSALSMKAGCYPSQQYSEMPCIGGLNPYEMATAFGYKGLLNPKKVDTEVRQVSNVIYESEDEDLYDFRFNI